VPAVEAHELVLVARQAEARAPHSWIRLYEFPPRLLRYAYFDRFLHDRGDRGEALLHDLPGHDESLAGPGYEIE
jgi:hypothetical protein